MDAFFAGMSTVLSSLGANGILPIMLLILGLIFGLKFTEALRAALTGACGMVGMNLVTDMLVAKMSPATTAMVERLGWQLDIVDTGWSLINYGWGAPAAGILIIMGIGLNLLLLFTNFTKTLMIDFWNYWSFLACGGLIYAATDGSVLWSCVGTAIYMIITWKWSDIVAPHLPGSQRHGGLHLAHRRYHRAPDDRSARYQAVPEDPRHPQRQG